MTDAPYSGYQIDSHLVAEAIIERLTSRRDSSVLEAAHLDDLLLGVAQDEPLAAPDGA